MTTEKSLIDSALRGWKSNVEQADKLFGGLSPEQLEQEVAPGKNLLIYLWSHLAGRSGRRCCSYSISSPACRSLG